MPSDGRLDSVAVTALVHLYRGEVARADTWRARLDNTTNWALTTSAGVMSFGLGSASATPAVFLVGILLVLNFLFIESRRYRAWDVFLRRVRILESALYAPLLRDEPLDGHRLRELTAMLEAPRVYLSFREALSQRIQRAYGPVLAVLLLAWLVKLTTRREELSSLGQFLDRAHIGFVPGWLVLALVALVYLALGVVAAIGMLTGPPPTELKAAPRRRRPLYAAFASPRGPAARRVQP